jgi:hypothetical protein
MTKDGLLKDIYIQKCGPNDIREGKQTLKRKILEKMIEKK